VRDIYLVIPAECLELIVEVVEECCLPDATWAPHSDDVPEIFIFLKRQIRY
jgi:hypothetical protein